MQTENFKSPTPPPPSPVKSKKVKTTTKTRKPRAKKVKKEKKEKTPEPPKKLSKILSTDLDERVKYLNRRMFFCRDEKKIVNYQNHLDKILKKEVVFV